MDAFQPVAPDWTQGAIHAQPFGCPACGASPLEAYAVWLNRRSPVWDDQQRRRWQEFYLCQCGQAWWGWSRDHPAGPVA